MTYIPCCIALFPQPVDLARLTAGIYKLPPLAGELANVQNLFPEWDIACEEWSVPFDTTIAPKPVVYPSSLQVARSATLAEFLGLPAREAPETAGAKGGKKKSDPKTGVAAEPTVDPLQQEQLQDAEGNQLPVVFRDSKASEIGSDSKSSNNGVGVEVEKDQATGTKQKQLAATSAPPASTSAFGFELPSAFRRAHNPQQLAALAEQSRLRHKITELQKQLLQQQSQGGGDGGGGEEEGVGAELEELEAELKRSLEENDVKAECPQGEYVDPFMCHAYLLLREYVPLVVSHQLAASEQEDGAVGVTAGATSAISAGQQQRQQAERQAQQTRHVLDENYLWRAIYPKLPNGKPCYNPSGKYCVKLYLAGKWRKVYVDDSVPLRSDGLPALASSEDRLELWPLILSKALYTVYSACGYEEVLHSHMLVCCEPLSFMI